MKTNLPSRFSLRPCFAYAALNGHLSPSLSSRGGEGEETANRSLFVANRAKPLKRLTRRRDQLHRAKAPVLMRDCGNRCEISRFNGLAILPVIILGFLATSAQAQQGVAQQPTSSTLDSSVIAETPYVVTDRDANQSVWSSITLETNDTTLQITARTNSYTELATGLNFWNQATAKWELSQEEFQITKDGYAIATNGQHSLILAPD